MWMGIFQPSRSSTALTPWEMLSMSATEPVKVVPRVAITATVFSVAYFSTSSPVNVKQLDGSGAEESDPEEEDEDDDEDEGDGEGEEDAGLLRGMKMGLMSK